MAGTIANRGYQCLSCDIKVPTVRKRSQRSARKRKLVDRIDGCTQLTFVLKPKESFEDSHESEAM